MKWIYTAELCIPLRLKRVEKEHKVDIEELETLRTKAMEIVEKALKEAGLEFDGVLSGPIQLVPDWMGDLDDAY